MGPRVGAKVADSRARDPSGASHCFRRNTPRMQEGGGGFQALINTPGNKSTDAAAMARGSDRDPTSEDGEVEAGASWERKGLL